MARYIVRSARKFVTAEGEVPAGTAVAVIESDMNPSDLSSWLLYGLAHAVKDDTTAVDIITRAEVAKSREVDEAEASDPEDTDLDLEEEQPTEEEPAEVPTESDVPEHWAAPLELDSRTVDALDDAGIASIDELRKKMDADEKIRGIGELREQEIMEALMAYESQ